MGAVIPRAFTQGHHDDELILKMGIEAAPVRELLCATRPSSGVSMWWQGSGLAFGV